VPAELIEKERSVATAKAAESGKPADIADQDDRRIRSEISQRSVFVQPNFREKRQANG
jgi:elongation factor Ts